jgi:hypothetical protein
MPEQSSAAPRDVILMSSGVGALREVAVGLSERFDVAFVDRASADEATGLGVQGVLPVASFTGPRPLDSADNDLARLAASLIEALPRIGHAMDSAYGAEGPEMLRGETLGKWLPGFVLAQARSIGYPLVAVSNLIESRKVRAFVTHEDVSPLWRSVTALCRARGIPTIHIPHAPCHLLPGVEDIHRETRTDWILASGVRVRDFYAGAGFPADRIRVVGGPQYDRVYREIGLSRELAREQLGLPQEELVICYGATWAQHTSLRGGFDAEIQAGYAAVLGLASGVGAHLIVTLHPHGPAGAEEAYRKNMEAAKVKGIVTRHHLFHVLRAADLVITQGPSNLSLEAAILGAPAVYLRTEDFDFATDLPGRANDHTDLPAAAQAMYESREDRARWDAFVTEYNATHAEGPVAAQRAAEAILEILGEEA